MGNYYLNIFLHSYFSPFSPPYIGFVPPLGNKLSLWWKLSFSTCVLQESDQGFWGKGSVAFETKSHQFYNSFSSNDAYPLPLKFTKVNCVLGIVYCIEVEKGRRNYCNGKIWSILSSKAHLHKIAKPFLIFLRMTDSKQPQMYKLRIMVRMVDDNIRMSMSQLKDEYYLPPVTELEDDEI